MSIWASMDVIACFNKDCAGCEECEVGEPYVYYASHILPEPYMPRDGSVDVGYLAKFVRWHRDNPTQTDPELEPEGYEPWLRLSVNESTVILDRSQVEKMVEGLTSWLKILDQ